MGVGDRGSLSLESVWEGMVGICFISFVFGILEVWFLVEFVFGIMGGVYCVSGRGFFRIGSLVEGFWFEKRLYVVVFRCL